MERICFCTSNVQFAHTEQKWIRLFSWFVANPQAGTFTPETPETTGSTANTIIIFLKEITGVLHTIKAMLSPANLFVTSIKHQKNKQSDKQTKSIPVSVNICCEIIRSINWCHRFINAIIIVSAIKTGPNSWNSKWSDRWEIKCFPWQIADILKVFENQMLVNLYCK